MKNQHLQMHLKLHYLMISFMTIKIIETVISKDYSELISIAYCTAIIIYSLFTLKKQMNENKNHKEDTYKN